MRAITIRDDVLRYRDDLPEPIAAADEVVVDVTQAGICETDLQLVRGYMGFAGILGHEFVGIATSGSFEGQRVVGEINCNCRACPRCDSGLGNHCSKRTVIGIDRHDGAFAERIAVPQHNLHSVPDTVTDDEAVFVEPLAAAFEILQQVKVADSDRVAILGDGRLGYLCAQVIGSSTRRMTAVGKHRLKLDRFARIGVSTVNLDDVDAEPVFDVVVDCTGSVTGLPLALSLVRPRGTVVMKTTVASRHHLSLAPIVIDEITLVGSRCGPFDKALAALQERTVDVSDLITHRYPLEGAEAALESAAQHDSFKVVFDVQSNGA